MTQMTQNHDAHIGINRALASKSRLIPIGKLKPFHRLSRRHPKEQIAVLKGSLEAFGFINPLIVDDENHILAGHGRWEAAKQLGLREVPVVEVDHLTPDEKRAYVIADNRIAEKSGFDPAILAVELEYLSSIDLDFDVSVTGFSIAEIDLVIGEAADAASLADQADLVDEAPPGPAVTRPGDVWNLGPHRLVCGDALSAASHEAALQGRKARLALTDPPYNVPIDGFVSGGGRHRDFAMAVGEMSTDQFTGFLATALTRMRSGVVDGGLIYSFMDWRHVLELEIAARRADLTTLNVCVWDKGTGGMGSFYRSQHELCFVYKVGTAPHLNTVELGRHGRTRTNVWKHPGLSTFGRGRDEALASHPTSKPVALLAEAIKDCTRRRDLVLDPFAGSGSTLIAAEKAGRIAACIELDPLYVDTIVRRWEKLTGETAVQADTGEDFSTAAVTRRDAATADGTSAGRSVLAPTLEARPTPVRHRVRAAAIPQEAAND
ncbi:MAG: site-specific DNA-methyltransferase [Pirellulaceae bacterium]